MFNIMENRKRPRFEMININNNICNGSVQGVASTTTAMGTATLATIGGQSFIINGQTAASLPANILLSICDENSNDSDEYILDHSMLTSVKQEQTVATQTTNTQNQMQQATLVTTVPQYRIVNQAGKALNSTPLNSSMVSSGAINANNSLLSNSVHLPSGCEIYVVKEVFDLPKQQISESNNTAITAGYKALANDNTIELKATSSLPAPRNTTTLNGSNRKTYTSNATTVTINNTSPVVTSTCNTAQSFNDDTAAKRSLILEAYKKRDDKRRATHNEVERRRRDKINSWIFKLKQMLPSEVTPSHINNTCINQNTNSTNRLSMQQPGTATNTRTPSNDSKSQILIKACEYIKSMQEEMNSLRECLTENENLRLKNQRLQDEINSLRSKQQNLRNTDRSLLRTNNNNNNNNANSSNNSNDNSDNSDNCEITLNSLNTTYANVQLFSPTSNQNNNHNDLVDLVGLTTNSNTTTTTPSLTPISRSYAKRHLIITDYVD